MKTLTKIITIAIAGIIAYAPNVYSLPKGVPEWFNNYKTEKNYIGHRNINMRGTIFHEHRYDIDGDGTQDVSELYIIPFLPEMGFEPYSTGYDISRDGTYQVNEVWVGNKRLDEVAKELGLKVKIPINAI